MAVRDLGDQALTTRAASMCAGHIGLGPSLVDEDQAAGINLGLMELPAFPLSGHVRPILFGGVQAFF